jgi:hypothetical protein
MCGQRAGGACGDDVIGSTAHNDLPSSNSVTPHCDDSDATIRNPCPGSAQVRAGRSRGCDRWKSRTSIRSSSPLRLAVSSHCVPACSTTFVTSSVTTTRALSRVAGSTAQSSHAERISRRAAPADTGSGVNCQRRRSQSHPSLGTATTYHQDGQSNRLRHSDAEGRHGPSARRVWPSPVRELDVDQ